MTCFSSSFCPKCQCFLPSFMHLKVQFFTYLFYLHELLHSIEGLWFKKAASFSTQSGSSFHCPLVYFSWDVPLRCTTFQMSVVFFPCWQFLFFCTLVLYWRALLLNIPILERWVLFQVLWIAWCITLHHSAKKGLTYHSSSVHSRMPVDWEKPCHAAYKDRMKSRSHFMLVFTRSTILNGFFLEVFIFILLDTVFLLYSHVLCSLHQVTSSALPRSITKKPRVLHFCQHNSV